MADNNNQKLRKAYITRLSARIDRWDADLHKLQAHARESSADVEIAVRKSIKHIMKNRDEVADRLKKIGAAGSEAWTGLRGRTDEIVDIVETAFEKVRKQFK